MKGKLCSYFYVISFSFSFAFPPVFAHILEELFARTLSLCRFISLTHPVVIMDIKQYLSEKFVNVLNPIHLLESCVELDLLQEVIQGVPFAHAKKTALLLDSIRCNTSSQRAFTWKKRYNSIPTTRKTKVQIRIGNHHVIAEEAGRETMSRVGTMASPLDVSAVFIWPIVRPDRAQHLGDSSLDTLKT